MFSCDLNLKALNRLHCGVWRICVLRAKGELFILVDLDIWGYLPPKCMFLEERDRELSVGGLEVGK